jgi:ferrous iron transport protein B
MNMQVLDKVPLITLVGPPNSGKTTLFNYLSGKNLKTANYPGATVEYSVAEFNEKYNLKADVLDSPGIVSLHPNSPDEFIAVNSLYNHPKYGVPDIVVVTVDSTQISRHLLLAKQLIDSGFNVIIALTMVDILYKRNLTVSSNQLTDELGCKAAKIDGRTGKGVDSLIKLMGENLDQISSKKRKTPEKLNGKLDFNSILDSYKLIEAIEKKVIYENSNNGKEIDLKAANKQLKVLNSFIRGKNGFEPDQTTLKIDNILLHKVWGLVFFFLIMALTFTSIFWLAQPIMDLVDNIFSLLSIQSVNILGNNWFGDLISDGLISGTGAVMVFVPQILILFLILGLLEDSGYLARGAMLIDKPLSKIGLNGRSFVPMLSGFACAIPAIMAARTISNKRERFLTIFVIPLMSCSARLPVYALLIAFLIPAGKAWVGGLILASIYIFSICSSISIAAVMNKFKGSLVKEEDNSSFILELPAYRRPKLKIVVKNSITNAKVYLKKAGPIILTFAIILWFLTYFPNYNPKVDTTNLSREEVSQAVGAERLSTSYASDLGKFIQPVMVPVGMDWRVGVSLIAAFTAREVFVSSMALIFKVTTDNENDLQSSLLNAMNKAEIGNTGKKLFTTATIAGLIVFFIFALQCLSTVAISKKETGGWRIPVLQVVVFTSVAYLLMFITVNGLRLIGVS